MFVKTYVFLRVFRILLFHIVLLEEQTCIQKVTTKSFTTASCWCGNANHPTIINWQQHAQLAKTYSTGKNILNWQKLTQLQKHIRLAKPARLAKAYSSGKSILNCWLSVSILTECFHTVNWKQKSSIQRNTSGSRNNVLYFSREQTFWHFHTCHMYISVLSRKHCKCRIRQLPTNEFKVLVCNV